MQKIDLVLAGILVLAGFLLFYNLDNLPLWRDEANTAGIAQNILTFGLPYVYDGRNFIATNPLEYNENYLLTWQTWLPYYLTAGTFALFGKSIFSARLPFAIVGLISILLTYLLAQELFNSKRISRIAAFLLTINTTYLLHMRQSRYYALVALFSLWMVYAYVSFLHSKKHSRTQFFISSFLLFNSNWFTLLVVMISLGTHFLIAGKSKEKLKSALLPVAVILLFTISWLLYTKPWRFTSGVSASFLGYLLQTVPDLNGVLKHYFLTLSFFAIPIALLFALLYYELLKEKIELKWFIAIAVTAVLFFNAYFLYYYKGIIDVIAFIGVIGLVFYLIWKYKKTEENTTLLFIVIIGMILLVSLARFKDIRNIIAVIPLVMILASYAVNKFSNRWIIYGLTALLATNLLSVIPLYPYTLAKESITQDFAKSIDYNNDYLKAKINPGIPVLDFILELRKELVGAEEKGCELLKRYGKEDEIVITVYDIWDTALKFYCPEFRINPKEHLVQPKRFLHYPKKEANWLLTDIKQNSPRIELVEKTKFNLAGETTRPEPWMHNFELQKEGVLYLYRLNLNETLKVDAR